MSADSEVLERVRALLPPTARPRQPSASTKSFAILADEDGTYRVTRNSAPLIDGVDLEFALVLLDRQLRISLGLAAPDRIFVHAGVVVHEDRAIVLPGLSLSGKTSLVVALIHAGAAYCSDEFAVLDNRGRVHPYPQPLRGDNHTALRTKQGTPESEHIAGEDPLAIGLVVFATYRPRAVWNPRRLSAGRGALAMVEHTLGPRERPDEAIRVIKRAIAGAVILQGERGEAAHVAAEILASLPAPTAVNCA